MSMRSWIRSVRSGTDPSRSSVCVSFSGTAMARSSSSPEIRLLWDQSSALDGNAHEVAPLRPAPVIVADLLVTQQMGEHEPGVAAALADAAVDDDVVTRFGSCLLLVDGAQLVGGLEGAVVRIDGPGPGDALGPGDVAAAQRALVGVLRHVEL